MNTQVGLLLKWSKINDEMKCINPQDEEKN